MEAKDNLVLIILCGPPCSGKTTWREQNTDILFERYNKAPVMTICKDDIREKLFGKDYKIDTKLEKAVNDHFYQQLGLAAKFQTGVIILDNTHCKESFIDGYLSIFRLMEQRGQITIYVKFFDVPLWKAHLRNIWRNIRTGKYIPYRMMKILCRNYNKIIKLKYKRFISDDI